MNEEITFGIFISFLMYAQWIYSLATYLYTEITKIRATSGPLERIFQIIDMKKISAELGAQKELLSAALSKISKIEFKDVCFSYNNNENVLNNICFTVTKNEKIAIVGESGSGKTTISKLLMKMYDVNSGRIFLDDYDISAISSAVIRGKIGMVMQDNLLFNRSVIENIMYGSENVSEDKVKEIICRMNLENFIRSLPEGYNTLLSEYARNISEGQKQRISIARTLIKDYPVYIFDEVTANLDKHTEEFILNSIMNNYNESIQIFITHSRTVMQKVNRILFIKEGKIIDSWNHHELINRCSHYQKFYTKIYAN
jgi:ABC-type multidrug transport system fused ATPase/permease subunit